MRNKLLLAFLLVAVAIALIPTLTDVLMGLLVRGERADMQTERALIIIAFTVLLGIGGAVVLSRTFTRRILDLAGAARRVADGDLTTAVIQSGGDEVGDLARSFRAMRDSLINVVQEVRATADRIHASAQALSSTAAEMNATTEEIAATGQNIARGAETQADMVNRTTGITRSLAESVEKIAARAEEARRAAEDSGEQASEGGRLAARANQALETVGGRVEKAAAAVEGFRARALQINKTVDVITHIAQQTHLLALNAAIEASRAGEQGRGFAVVAEEVRKLADGARRFAEQISELADQINGGSGEVIAAMTEARDAARESQSVVGGAASVLQEIVKRVDATRGQVVMISQLSAEQARGEEGLVRAIEEIAKIAEDNAAGTEQSSAATQEQTASMQELSASAQDLARSSEKLRELIALFKVGP